MDAVSTMSGLDLIIAVIAALFSGGVVTAIVQAVFNRGSARAQAATSIADVAQAVNELNTSLRKEIVDLKKELIKLTDAIDAALPNMAPCVPPTHIDELRSANNAAKLVI